jgi:hypothetical protein
MRSTKFVYSFMKLVLTPGEGYDRDDSVEAKALDEDRRGELGEDVEDVEDRYRGLC